MVIGDEHFIFSDSEECVVAEIGSIQLKILFMLKKI